MALNIVTFKDYQKYMGNAGRATAGPKNIGVGVSAPWANKGFYNHQAMEITQTPREFETLIRPMFRDYQTRHPFHPTKAALTNPGLLMIERNKWLKRCSDYVKNHQKEQAPWNWRQFWENKEDKKPRHNVKPTSSWLKHIKVNGSICSIDLGGGKFYDYRITNPKKLQEFLQQQSMGHVIAKIAAAGRRNRNDATTVGGLTPIPRLRKH